MRLWVWIKTLVSCFSKCFLHPKCDIWGLPHFQIFWKSKRFGQRKTCQQRHAAVFKTLHCSHHAIHIPATVEHRGWSLSLARSHHSVARGQIPPATGEKCLLNSGAGESLESRSFRCFRRSYWAILDQRSWCMLMLVFVWTRSNSTGASSHFQEFRNPLANRGWWPYKNQKPIPPIICGCIIQISILHRPIEFVLEGMKISRPPTSQAALQVTTTKITTVTTTEALVLRRRECKLPRREMQVITTTS